MDAARNLFLVTLLVTTGIHLSAESKVEVGEINGARFRIDLPDQWNGSVVLYCHGFNPSPVRFDAAEPPSAVLQVFLEQGFALAQSAYAETGWALPEGIHDTEALRQYFSRKYGLPKEVFVTGRSSGGLLTIALVEMFPNAYDGGLPLCGTNGATAWLVERRDFDLLVVFDYYFPGVLPSPDRILLSYSADRQLLEQLLDQNPERATSLRRFSGHPNNRGLAGALAFYTMSLADWQRRAGGNAFDNRNTVYSGTSDDNAVNDGVKRYTADRRASEFLQRYYAPTGALKRPVLAIQTTYDPVVPGWLTNAYSTITKQAGTQDLFVQQYVKRDGHCNITPQQVSRGFTALREWKSTGTRPKPGLSQ